MCAAFGQALKNWPRLCSIGQLARQGGRICRQEREREREIYSWKVGITTTFSCNQQPFFLQLYGPRFFMLYQNTTYSSMDEALLVIF